MAGLKQIKLKIRSIEKTRKVTKAMEAVSAAKMRKAQARAIAGRPYARAASTILARVSGARDLRSHPLTATREARRALYIVITSDKGLAGGLNGNILRAAQNDIAALGLAPERVGIFAVGRKAQDYFSRRGYNIESFRESAGESLTHEIVRELTMGAAARFTEGAFDLVKICYQNFRSTFEQRPIVRTMFPLSLDELTGVVADIAPTKGAYSTQPSAHSPQPATYSIEPSADEILDAILPRLASIFVFHALLESQASEHSARMVAMKSASDKGAERQHALTLQFNKARQASITREVSEITGGMEAMAS